MAGRGDRQGDVRSQRDEISSTPVGGEIEEVSSPYVRARVLSAAVIRKKIVARNNAVMRTVS